MIFHRVINNFLIQTGESRSDKSVVVNDKDNDKYMSTYGLDNVNGSKNEEAIPGSEAFITRKKLELSPRIRFNHRGQIAMALPLDDEDVKEDGTASSLARQFFITLDEAPFLQSKYVIFGTVSGDTIFNALRIGRTETVDEESGQLADVENAPKIIDIRIETHLFDDLVMTIEDKVPWKICLQNGNDKEMSSMKKRRKKRKGKKDLNVLSFGAEMEDGDDGGLGSGMVSSYDMKNGKANGNKKDDVVKAEVKIKHRKKKVESLKNEEAVDVDETKMKEEKNDAPEKKQRILKQSDGNEDDQESNDVQFAKKSKDRQIRRESQESRSEVSKPTIPEKKKKPKISAVEARRLKYMSMKGNTSKSKQRDSNTMCKLSEFKSKMLEVKGVKVKKDKSKKKKKHKKDQEEKPSSSSVVYSGQVLENDDFDENDTSWLKGRFKCKRHIDHDSKASAITGGDGRSMNDYEVIDGKDDNGNKHERKRRRK